MSDLRRRPGGGDDADLEPDSKDDRGVPRWVKLIGLAVILVLAVMIAVMLLAGGQHGPGRHLSSLGVATTSPPLSAVDPTGAGGTA